MCGPLIKKAVFTEIVLFINKYMRNHRIMKILSIKLDEGESTWHF